MNFNSLQDRVVVITGASSGIGKLAVEELLKQGARVVLAARSIDEMLEHLMELGTDDRHALAVQTDVSDPMQVQVLAQRAREHFGKIDVWVNNAAVSIYGRVDEIEPDEMSRLIDVNLKGQMYGSLEAVRLFKEQGYGNLVNVSSVEGKTPLPLQSAYAASKHGVVGFTNSLREELVHDGQVDQIGVSLVMPASMDTPLFQHAKSKTGLQPYPVPPIYDPMMTVRAILRCAKRPVREVVVGGAGKTLVAMSRFFPKLAEQYVARFTYNQQQTEIPKPIEGDDNLYAPMPDSHDVRGGIGTTGEHLRQTAARHPVQVGLAVAIPVFLVTMFLRSQRRPA